MKSQKHLITFNKKNIGVREENDGCRVYEIRNHDFHEHTQALSDGN
jgi:hypothetical protein